MGPTYIPIARGIPTLAWPLLVLCCASCNRKGPAAPPAPPPPTVTVVRPAVEEVIDYREYTGRTAAVESVEVRSRVGGYLLSVEFKEGAEVQMGDLLFRIDARPYEADLRQAEANVAAQEAQLQRYQLDLNRARELIGTAAISQQELDVAIASAASARAQLRSLEAALAHAKLDLEYTEIRSPITGRTSRALVTPGNLIVSDSTVLTNVVSMDPMYAYFDVDESSALDYRQRVRQSQVESARVTPIDVSLGLSNETNHPHPGLIDFVDNVTDIGTGNIQVRARFPNADGALLPGLFCRVRVPFTRPYDALLVPQTALAMNQQGRYVLVVNDDNKVEPHVVEVGTSHGGMVAIRSGIDRNDRVVVSGLQKARPGSQVKPVMEDAVKFVTRTLGPSALQEDTEDKDRDNGQNSGPTGETAGQATGQTTGQANAPAEKSASQAAQPTSAAGQPRRSNEPRYGTAEESSDAPPRNTENRAAPSGAAPGRAAQSPSAGGTK